MSLSIGIDLGTSGINVVIFADGTRPMAQASQAIEVSIPRGGLV